MSREFRMLALCLTKAEMRMEVNAVRRDIYTPVNMIS